MILSTYSEISGIRDKEIDIMEELIIKCYKNLFQSTGCPPSLHRLYMDVMYEFEVGAYDLVYGFKENFICEEWIALYLGLNKYIFEQGTSWYGTAQIRMFSSIFNDTNSYSEDEEYLKEVGLIGESEIRVSRG